MTTAIVLIPVDYLNSFEVANKVRNQTYKTSTALRIQLAMELKAEEAGEDGSTNIADIEIYDLDDFVTAMNVEIINTIGTFMTYVNFE